MSKKKQTFEYEQAMTRLDGIIQRFDEGGMTLDEMEAAFVEGMELVKQCSARLDRMETRVSELLKDHESVEWNADEEDEDENVSD